MVVPGVNYWLPFTPILPAGRNEGDHSCPILHSGAPMSRPLPFRSSMTFGLPEIPRDSLGLDEDGDWVDMNVELAGRPYILLPLSNTK